MLIQNSVLILIFSCLGIVVSKILYSLDIKNSKYIFFICCILVGYACHFTGKDARTLALCEVMTMILISIAYYDARTRIIPDYFHIIIIACALTNVDYKKIYINLACTVGVYILFAVINKIREEAVGGGDIKLYLSLAFLTGIKVFPVLFLSTLSLMIVNLIRKKKNKDKGNQGYAFAPYISAFAIPLMII